VRSAVSRSPESVIAIVPGARSASSKRPASSVVTEAPPSMARVTPEIGARVRRSRTTPASVAVVGATGASVNRYA